MMWPVTDINTYVTIFLSKKYWSFFAPMTRRSETSSLSIWMNKTPGQKGNCKICVAVLPVYSFHYYNKQLCQSQKKHKR